MKSKTTTGALATTGMMTQKNVTNSLHKKKCDGCKRAEGADKNHVYTCNCNVK